jgi:hypothetical protein
MVELFFGRSGIIRLDLSGPKTTISTSQSTSKWTIPEVTKVKVNRGQPIDIVLAQAHKIVFFLTWSFFLTHVASLRKQNILTRRHHWDHICTT